MADKLQWKPAQDRGKGAECADAPSKDSLGGKAGRFLIASDLGKQFLYLNGHIVAMRSGADAIAQLKERAEAFL